MSGIAGILDFAAPSVDRGAVERMAQSMVHRGPDGIAVWEGRAACLGHCAMHTTPESLDERQPLSTVDGERVLVMDGRIDNWEGLRRELLARGASLRDRSDAELVLAAWQHWGEECLAHLEGDFAFVIWDNAARRAFCARDSMGNKPLYFSWDGKRLVFASEIRALMASGLIQPRVNDGMLAELFAGDWRSHEETLWMGVQRLSSAHSMRVAASGLSSRRYWQPDPRQELRYRDEREYTEHYGAWLRERVRRLSRTHRPLAFDVSGGLDSSAVICTAAALQREGALLAPEIRAYTTTFLDLPEADEVRYARAVGRHIGLTIEEVPRVIQDREWYRQRARFSCDFPGYPNASSFVAQRRRSIEDGCRVTMTGETGDQWLDGTRLYYAEEIARGRVGPLFEWLRSDMAEFGVATALRWLLRFGLFELLGPETQRRIRAILGKLHAPRTDHYWLSIAMRERLSARGGEPSFATEAARHPGQLDLFKRLGSAVMMQIHERVELDASLMGMELRHPFHDASFVQLMMALPERLRLRGATNKYLHVMAMRGQMPDEVLDRRDKADFTPIFPAALRAIRADLLEGIPARRPGWVDAEGMRRLVGEVERGAAPGLALWVLWEIFGYDLAVSEWFASGMKEES